MADSELTYLSRADVAAAAQHVDPVAVVDRTLRLHASGSTSLPTEAYLGWTTPDGSAARSIALPAGVWGNAPAVGLKIINSSLGNTARGVPRAQGLTVLFDPETAHPSVVLEAASLSALRTAAYTAVSVAHLAVRPPRNIAIVGCGAIGRAHVDLLHRTEPDAAFRLFDLDPVRLVAAGNEVAAGGTPCTTAASAQDAVAECDVVVTATTTTTGYLALAWLAPGALIAHVSLDDVLPEVVAGADLVLVDDWNLVRADHRRLLGRLHRAGDLLGPEGGPTGPVQRGGRAVDGTLADVLVRRHPGRTEPHQVILSNPFGMGVLDVALAAEAARSAQERGLGVRLQI